jgi:hypothetical protein
VRIAWPQIEIKAGLINLYLIPPKMRKMAAKVIYFKYTKKRFKMRKTIV